MPLTTFIVTPILKKRIAVLLALPAAPLAVIFFRYFVFHRKGWTTIEIQYEAIFWFVRMLLAPLLVVCTLRFWTEFNETLVLGVKLIFGFILFSLLHWSLSIGVSKMLVHDLDHRGLNLFNTIKEKSTPINLFIYASSIFILYAWIYFERLRETGNRSMALENELLQHRTQTWVKGAPENGMPAVGIGNLVIKSAGRTVFVPMDAINMVLSYGPYVKIVTVEDKTHLLQRPLYQLEKQLPPNFKRVHRSCIVNGQIVKEVRSLKNGDYTLILSNGSEIRASRTFRENIKGLLGHDRLVL